MRRTALLALAVLVAVSGLVARTLLTADSARQRSGAPLEAPSFATDENRTAAATRAAAVRLGDAASPVDDGDAAIAPDREDAASLAVLVLEVDGTPVPGASVATVVPETGAIEAQVRTADAKGRARFSELDLTGAEALIAMIDRAGEPAVGLALRPDPQVTEVILRLGPALRVRGIVETTDGERVVGAACSLVADGDAKLPTSLAAVLSDADGAVVFPTLPVAAVPSPVRVRVEFRGSAVTLADVDASGRFTARLHPRPWVRGRCVDEGGLPVATAIVTLDGGAGARTGPDGAFELPLEHDDRVLLVDPPDHAPREFAIDGASEDLTLGDVVLSSGRAIRGRVVDAAGRALPGVEVSATPDDWRWRRTATSRADGTFEVPLLPVGTQVELRTDVPGPDAGDDERFVRAVAGDMDARVTLACDRLVVARLLRSEDERSFEAEWFAVGFRDGGRRRFSGHARVGGIDRVTFRAPLVGEQTIEFRVTGTDDVERTAEIVVVASGTATADADVRLPPAPR